jgi:hypothetical protein
LASFLTNATPLKGGIGLWELTGAITVTLA